MISLSIPHPHPPLKNIQKKNLKIQWKLNNYFSFCISEYRHMAYYIDIGVKLSTGVLRIKPPTPPFSQALIFMHNKGKCQKVGYPFHLKDFPLYIIIRNKQEKSSRSLGTSHCEPGLIKGFGHLSGNGRHRYTNYKLHIHTMLSKI